MPTKSGLSHGFATFISILLGTVISNYLSAHKTIFTRATRSAGDIFTTSLGINQSNTIVGMLLISSVLAFMWGVAYHLARN